MHRDYQGIRAYAPSHPAIILPTGILGECVEFVRRWYEIVYHLTFQDIPSAKDFASIETMMDTQTGEIYPLLSFRNPTLYDFKVGDILVFKLIDLYKPHGHVAVVTWVQSGNRVFLSEQNWAWEHARYSRQLTEEDLNDVEVVRRVSCT
jgi:hypothetical protein